MGDSMFSIFKNYFRTKIEISDEQWKSAEEYLSFIKIRHGHKLLEPGEISNYGYFVVNGCLRNYFMKEGKEHIIQFAPEHWWIGANYAVPKPEPSFVYIDAVENSKVILFNHEFIAHLLLTVPGFMDFRQNLQQNQFRNLEKRIMILLGSSAEERYTYFIKTYPNLAIRLPQKMIASYLGMTPQSLSRVRSQYNAGLKTIENVSR